MSEDLLHATLSPSASERWISCPASVRVSKQLGRPDIPSVYALEGTAAHALGELRARYRLLKELTHEEYRLALRAWHRSYDYVVDDFDVMLEYADAYVDLLKAKMVEHPGSALMLEQRVKSGLPHCDGTADAVIVSLTHVEIVDLKYGKGVEVVAEGNPQLRLYGVGALETFGVDVESVTMTVHQPRLNHTLSETLTPAELLAWRDGLLPIAELALGPNAPFGPSEAACRWCPAAGRCKAQLEWATSQDFSIPVDTLDEWEMAEALGMVGAIEEWCAAVRNQALHMAYSESREIPGHKVVASRGKRKVTNPEGAIAALKAFGFLDAEISTTKIKGIGELEKLLKKDFRIVLGPFVEKVGGNQPSLVGEDDVRPAMDPNSEAAKEFRDV